LPDFWLLVALSAESCNCYAGNYPDIADGCGYNTSTQTGNNADSVADNRDAQPLDRDNTGTRLHPKQHNRN